MHEQQYYRDKAAKLRQLALITTNVIVRKTLEEIANDFDDLAEDLELGAIEIIHPELLPQRRRRPPES